MTTEQESIFWEVIDTFDKEGVLPYVIVIGTWAEYLFSKSIIPDFMTDFKTRDIDFMYPNINKPKKNIHIVSILNKIGFECNYDYFTGVIKFVKEDIVTIEFLTRSLCRGTEHNEVIKAMGIMVESMRDLNIINDFSMSVEVNNYHINVPDPAVFVINKLLIYPTRVPVYKRESDIESVRNILDCKEGDPIYSSMLNCIYNLLSKKEKKIVDKVAKENDINLKQFINL